MAVDPDRAFRHDLAMSGLFVRLKRFWDGQARLGKVLTIVVAVVIVYAAIGAISNVGDEPNGESSDAIPLLSRNGKWTAFTSDDGIHVGRLGAVARRITDPGKGTDDYPEWSPDGLRIVFARFGGEWSDPQMLYVVNRDGSGLRRLTKGDDTDPSWSPDGKTIAFNHKHVALVSLDENVYAIDVNGTGKRLLLGNAREPAWSPDGSKIAFVRQDGRGLLGGAIAILDLKTKRIEQVVPSKRYAGAPAWSPDGRQIAFEESSHVPSDEPYGFGIPEIYVVNVDGTGLRRLTKDREAYDWAPTWTPDGRIVFASDRGGPSQLYVMNGDGTGVRRFVIERK